MNPADQSMCRRCERMTEPGAHHCQCGWPTPLASFKERTEWEVKQWKLYVQRQAVSVEN